MPWPVLAAAARPVASAAPWRRLPSPGMAAAVWPPPLPVRAPAGAGSAAEADAAAEPVPVVPDLLFTEAELARSSAAAAAVAGRDARRAALGEVAAREAGALEELAAGLVRARDARREAEAASRRQLAEVATAVARAFAVGGSGDADRALAVLATMLDGLPGIAAARLVVDPPTAAALEGRLPELALRAGFPIAVEADARRAPGAVQLLWDGGWADHDPGELGERIAELLAVHAAPHSAAETDGGQLKAHEPAGAAL